MPQPATELLWLLTAGSVTVLIVLAALVVSLVLHQRRVAAMTRAFHGELLNAHEAERGRVARELHDGLIQRVAILSTEVAHLEDSKRLDPSRFAAWATSFRAELHELASDIRRIAHGMHPSTLDNLGLVAALQALAEEVDNTDELRVELMVEDPAVRVDPAVGLCLYRAAQEGLQNVLLHAQVRAAAIRLRTRGTSVELTVADSGAGRPAGTARSGLGLRSLEERARLVGGTVSFRSAPGKGSELVVTVPA